MQSLKAPTPSTATSGFSPNTKSERFSKGPQQFVTQRPAKIRLNSQKQVDAAKLFINKEKVIIKNLAKLEPLSHLIDDEKLVELIDANSGRCFTELSHLPVHKPTIKGENFLIKNPRPPRKETSNKNLETVYGTEAFRIRTVRSVNERKIRKKMIRQFANRRGLN